MSNVFWRVANKKNNESKLDDPRSKFDCIDLNCILETEEVWLRKQVTRIAFSYCINTVQQRELTDSEFNFYFSSPLPWHLQAVDLSYKVLRNIKNGPMISFDYRSEISFNLPMHFPPAFFSRTYAILEAFHWREKSFFWKSVCDKRWGNLN